MMRFLKRQLTCLALVFAPCLAFGQSEWYNTYQDTDFRSIAYGNSTFVAIGGAIMTSSDGIAWRPQPLPVPATLYAVAYVAGRFVAVGGAFVGGVVLISSDGDSWQTVTLDSPCSLKGVAYGNGTYVGVGNRGGRGGILISRDAVAWTERPSVPNPLNTIAYGNGVFICAGDKGTILSSTDGSSWTVRSSGVSGDIRGVTFGNGRFVAVGYDSNKILTSTDGSSWESVSVAAARGLNAVAYGNGEFVAVGFVTGTWEAVGRILTSKDGVTWTELPRVASVYLNGVAFGNNRFVVVGESGTILTSTDGESFAISTSGFGRCGYGCEFFDVAYGNGTFIALGGERATSMTKVRVLPDGLSWRTDFFPGGESIIDITWGGGLFVAVGDGGKILTSIEGDSWTAQKSGTAESLSTVAWGGGIFVATGYKVVLTSPDAVAWSLQASSTLGGGALAYGNGSFVSVGRGGILRSPNGVAWTLVSDLTGWDVIYANGFFVAETSGGVLTSLDGIAWTVASRQTAANVAYGNGSFVAVDRTYTTDSPILLVSPNAIEWTAVSVPTGLGLSAVAFGEGTFVAVGGGGVYSLGTMLVSRSLATGLVLTETGVAASPTSQGTSVFSFRFPTIAGQEYVVESSDSLTASAWIPLQTITGDGSLKTFFEDIRGLLARFYRVRRAETALSLKLPLPGGKHWLLTTEVGDGGCTASSPPEPSHTGVNYFSLDFSPRSLENGGNPESSVKVYAAGDGKVATVGTDPNSPNGYYVVLDHDSDGDVKTGYSTRYLHLRDFPLVNAGDSVRQGQQLGFVGQTGTDHAHLHIGLRFKDDGGSDEATKSELRRVRMEGLTFEEYKTECAPGTSTPMKYYPSTNSP